MALDRLTKVDGGGISTTSDYRVGIITASKFVGPFDGTGGNFSGVVTATNGVFSGNISAVDGTFSGNVTIGGTLTYEDVTNIDSVGIITARDGIHVGAGLSVVGVSTFTATITATGGVRVPDGSVSANYISAGDSQDIKIYHDGSHSYIRDTGTGGLRITTNSFNVLNSSNGESMITGTEDGAVKLYHDHNLRLETDTSRTIFRGGAGIGVYGEVGENHNGQISLHPTGSAVYTNLFFYNAAGNSYASIIGHAGGTLFFTGGTNSPLRHRVSGTGFHSFQEGNNEKVRITAGGTVNIGGDLTNTTGKLKVTGNSTFNGDLDVDGHTNLDNVSIAGVSTFTGQLNANAVEVNSTINVIGESTFRDRIQLVDSAPEILLSVPSGGLDSRILNDGSGNLIIGHGINSDTPTERLRIHADGEVDVKGGAAGQNALLVTGNYSASNNVDIQTWQRIGGAVQAKMIYKDASTDMHFGTDTAHNFSLMTAGTARIKIANNSAATSIGGSNVFNAMLTVQGDISGELFRLKAAENTTRLMISGLDTSDVEINLYDKNGAQKGILVGGETEFALKAPNNSAPLKFYTNNGSSIGERLRISSNGQVCIGSGFVGGGGQLTIRGLGVNSYAVQDYQYIGTPSNNTTTLAQIRFTANTTGSSVIQGAVIKAMSDNAWSASGDAPTRLEFHTADDGSATLKNRLTIFGDGSITQNRGNPDASATFRISRSGSGVAELRFDTAASNTASLYLGTDGELIIRYGGTEHTRFNPGGNLTVTGEVAASQDYPNFRPTLDFNFAASKKLDSRITYQRTGPASFTDEFGKVVLVGENTPRFDHDPTTRECKGLLIEHSRTNIHPYSQDLSNWTVESGGSVTANTHISPAGDQTADSLNGTQSGSSAYRSFALTSGTAYTFTVFLKYVSGNTDIQIQIGDAPFTRSYATFNTSTGALVSSSGGTQTVNDVVAFPNGWYRVSITRTPTSTASGFMDINHISSTASTVAVWGAQVEAGSYATSYIPTTDATNVTRGADFTTLLEDDFTDAISQTEGTLVVEYDNVTSDGYVLSLDGSGGDKIGMVNSNGYQLMGQAGGSSQGTTDNGTLLSGTNRFALAYKTNDAAISINGNTATVDTSYTLPTTTFMSIGHRQYQYDQLGSCIARIMYYNSRLPNSQLKTLSTR